MYVCEHARLQVRIVCDCEYVSSCMSVREWYCTILVGRLAVGVDEIDRLLTARESGPIPARSLRKETSDEAPRGGAPPGKPLRPPPDIYMRN